MSSNWYVADVLCSLIFSLTILARPTSGTEKHRKRLATKTVASVARTLVVKGWRSQDYERILRNNLQQLDSDYEEVQGKACISGIWYVDGTSRITKCFCTHICRSEPSSRLPDSAQPAWHGQDIGEDGRSSFKIYICTRDVSCCLQLWRYISSFSLQVGFDIGPWHLDTGICFGQVRSGDRAMQTWPGLQ